MESRSLVIWIWNTVKKELFARREVKLPHPAEALVEKSADFRAGPLEALRPEPQGPHIMASVEDLDVADKKARSFNRRKNSGIGSMSSALVFMT